LEIRFELQVQGGGYLKWLRWLKGSAGKIWFNESTSSENLLLSFATKGSKLKKRTRMPGVYMLAVPMQSLVESARWFH